MTSERVAQTPGRWRRPRSDNSRAQAPRPSLSPLPSHTVVPTLRSEDGAWGLRGASSLDQGGGTISETPKSLPTAANLSLSRRREVTVLPGTWCHCHGQAGARGPPRRVCGAAGAGRPGPNVPRLELWVGPGRCVTWTSRSFSLSCSGFAQWPTLLPGLSPE